MNSKTWIRTALLSLPILLLAACTSTPRVETLPAVTPRQTGTTAESAAYSASRATEPRRSKLYLQAALLSGTDNPQRRTSNLLNLINTSSLSSQEMASYLLLQADIRVHSDTPGDAQQWLSTLYRPALKPVQQQQYDILQATLYDLEGNHREAIVYWGNAIKTRNNDIPEELYINLWYSMLQENSETLRALLQQSNNPDLTPWLELAIIYRSPEELSQQLKQIEQWQNRWAGSAAYAHQPRAISTLQTTPAYQPQHIALLLPLTGPQATAGGAVRDGFMAGYYQALNSHLENLPDIQFYDTHDADTSQLAQRAQDEGAELIIGPLGRSAARESLENSNIVIPQLILNQIPELKPGSTHPIYQFSLASENEARQTAERAWQDGYRNPVLITPESDWGERVATTFTETWEQLGGKVLEQQTFSGKGDYNTSVSEALMVNSSIKRANSLTRIIGQRLDYTPRRREDIDMIFIAGNASQGRQLKPALDFYFAYNLPTYTVSSMYSGEIDRVQDRDLNDVRIPLMPWFVDSSTPLKSSIQKVWSNSSGPLAPLYALGADAWRIYPRLEQLTQSQGAQMFGATGILTIDEQREVERELRWQYFRNGRPVPLSRERSMSPNKENVLENENSQHKG